MKKTWAITVLQVCLASSAWASFDIVSDSAYLNQSTGKTTFHFEFSQPVDLTTLDDNGAAGRSFQVFVHGDESLDYPDKYAAIIRTAESPATASNVIVRAASPRNDAEASDPLSGGWGRVLATAPITISGNGVTFTLDNASFNYFGNEVFKYNLEAYEYGGLSSYVVDSVATLTPVPEVGTPVQMWLGLGLTAVCVRGRGKTRRALGHSTI